MSARPPATRDVLELPGGLFRLRQIAPPFEGSATKANPAKAGDAKPRGYRTPFACHASRAAEPLQRVLFYAISHAVALHTLASHRGRSLRHTGAVEHRRKRPNRAVGCRSRKPGARSFAELPVSRLWLHAGRRQRACFGPLDRYGGRH